MNRITNGAPSAMETSKDWQLEILMEKLRSKASQFKSFSEISKNVRMTMLDKRYALDGVEKSQHQKCLDTLQHSIKVNSLQSMVERLESLTRQLGLKLMTGPSDVQLFISSDMFYLEILLDSSGSVQDVKVHHDGKTEQQSCAELVNCLSKGDFQDFTAQLEGFASIYQLNAEKKVKSKAFTALQSLESDLSTLAQLQSFIKDPFNLVYKSPVGILEKRKGGHPMKLTYFVSPYDLIDEESSDLKALDVDLITGKSLGCSVTVCMEGSAAHKLQTATLITVSRNMNGKSTPTFSSLTSQNSSVIPATFVLKLNKPIPMCLSLINQIQNVTELEWPDTSSKQPLLNLIVNQASDGKMTSLNNRGLFVTLTDQNHCYFMTEAKNMEGLLVHSIPFTHPAKVSQILTMLRQQALFNTVISSCVRPKSKQDFENLVMLEVSALSWTHISITLEHPTEESMATIEVDLTDITKLTCKIHTPGTPPPPNTPDVVSELASRILNRTFSLPVTMRSVIKLWERQSEVSSSTFSRGSLHYNGGNGAGQDFNLPLDSCDPGGRKGGANGAGPPMTDFDHLDTAGGGGKICSDGASHGQSFFLSGEETSFRSFQSGDVGSSMDFAGILMGQGGDKGNKRWKRNKTDDPSWKLKRKLGEASDEILIDASSSDSTSRSTPLSQDTTEVSTPNSALGFHSSDLELSTMSSDVPEMHGKKDDSSDNGDEPEEILEDLSTGESKEARRHSRDQKSPSNIIMELTDKNLVPPSVSITPISPTVATFQASEKRSTSTVEIIPIAHSPGPTFSNSITITPIQQKTEQDKYKDRKSSKKEDKGRLEKKRKRKRDDSPMGPPEKVPPSKSDPKPGLALTYKPSESPPLSSSPTHRAGSLSGKLSPSLMKQTLKSPKHSPAYVPSSSPKHGITGSPKHAMSPKHPASGGSGKPSMQALKSATSSPTGKSESKSGKSGSRDSSREKEKKVSNLFITGGGQKVKVSSSKSKPIEISSSPECTIIPQDGSSSPGGSLEKSNQARNRKGMLSAIVDKLKSAQHCDVAADLSGKSNNNNRERSSSVSGQISKASDAKTTKNSEYMVKPSSDGIKLTINKTRTKDPSMKSANKTMKVHTGLKPGVNSGPASKKPQQLGLKSGSPKPPSTGAKTGISINKSKSSEIPKSAGKDGRPKLNKSSSEKSIFSSKEKGKSSPLKDEPDGYKYNAAPLMMEGIMKHLDKNFQIPKLSARMGGSDDRKMLASKEGVNNVNRTSIVDGKLYQDQSKNDTKYQNCSLLLNNKLPDGADKSRAALNNVHAQPPSMLLPSTSPRKEYDSSEDRKKLYPDQPLSLSTKSNMFVTPSNPRDDKKDKKDDGLLDFSKQSDKGLGFPMSPSVSVHIVKSPAPSPLINPSPHGASPCITDDELMDEALIGIGK